MPGAGSDLAVAVARQLGDEAHVVVPDLDHLLADVVLGAAAGRRACPPGGKETCQTGGAPAQGHAGQGRTQDSPPLSPGPHRQARRQNLREEAAGLAPWPQIGVSVRPSNSVFENSSSFLLNHQPTFYWDVSYSTGSRVNNVGITVYGAGRALEMPGETFCIVLHTKN